MRQTVDHGRNARLVSNAISDMERGSNMYEIELARECPHRPRNSLRGALRKVDGSTEAVSEKKRPDMIGNREDRQRSSLVSNRWPVIWKRPAQEAVIKADIFEA